MNFQSLVLLVILGSLRVLPAVGQVPAGPNPLAPKTEVGSSTAANLRVKFRGLRNTKGWIGMLLFNGEEGYPGDYKKAFKLAYSRVKEGETVFEFKNIPFGNYAITMLHDENANMNIDFNILGMPKEGYGASNNAARYFGPPRYRDARFVVDRAEQEEVIKPIYWW